MMRVVGVRFKPAGKIYDVDPMDFEINLNDYVIVETARGVEYGQAVIAPRDVSEEDIVSPLKQVLRVADEADHYIHRNNQEKAAEARIICEEKIAEHGLEMKIVDSEYTFDNNKVIFYFTADGRVDFRELVKDLASVFRTRIELRQIGVRDEAKMVGGLGSCGQVCCCSRFLGDFAPVSIKMAKEQDLSLNPGKISGVCGRLMCCLRYENDLYKEKNRRVPSVGTIVETPEGRGAVVESHILTEEIKVRLDDAPEELVPFMAEEVRKINKNRRDRDSGHGEK